MFVDESGLDPRLDDSLIMAGFIGEVSEWEKASDAWDRCLNESPKIEYFSHKEVTSRSGQFWKFSEKEANEKVSSLARVISQFSLQGVCTAVPHVIFANRDSRSAKGMMGSRPYDWGFFSLVIGVLDLMRWPNIEVTVDFVFDARPELRSCIQYFEELKTYHLAEQMRHAGECIPGDDKKIVALQMADLLAFQCSTIVRNQQRTEQFEIISAAKPIIQWTCEVPATTPDALKAQRASAALYQTANALLKRIYGDKEKTLNLVQDVEQLRQEKARFDEEFEKLLSIYDETGWQAFFETREFVKALKNVRSVIKQ